MNDADTGEATVRPPPTPATSAAAVTPRWWVNAKRRLVELLIVFFGVYAAFLLNRFDSERHDARRQTQILAALEREIRANLDELKGELAGIEPEITEFDRQLASGEMPPLGISYTNSSYSASDDATLLQAGGLELLDMETIELLRKVNALQRSLGAATHNHFEVCLTELANHNPEDFYDPATRQLRKRYVWYPLVIHRLVADAKELVAAEEALVNHIESGRKSGGGGVR